MPIGTDICTIVVSIVTPSTGILLDGYENIIPPGSVVTNEGYTNIVPAEDTLGTIFDPPYGIKTFNSSGLPLLEWNLVWINNANSSAIDVEIRDVIPDGTTYVIDSISCEARGSSSTDNCEYDPINNLVFWSGDIGPDRGATNESNADNEVVITFQVEIPDSMNVVSNLATAQVDSNGDGNFDNEISPRSTSLSNTSVWNRIEDLLPALPSADVLPESGFAPNRITNLPKKPAELYPSFANLNDLWLEIPKLGLQMPIVGIPLRNGEWNVTWLGHDAGWLENTAFPTWAGNTVITGHVWDPYNNPGPFAKLIDLRTGDRFTIHAFGQVYTYEVTDSLLVRPDDLGVIAHSEYDTVTLLTCEGWNARTDEYRYRRIVNAVLVNVE